MLRFPIKFCLNLMVSFLDYDTKAKLVNDKQKDQDGLKFRELQMIVDNPPVVFLGDKDSLNIFNESFVNNPEKKLADKDSKLTNKKMKFHYEVLNIEQKLLSIRIQNLHEMKTLSYTVEDHFKLINNFFKEIDISIQATLKNCQEMTLTFTSEVKPVNKLIFSYEPLEIKAFQISF